MQVRNWLYVEDFGRGIGHVLAHGAPGEAYNVGGPDECPNIEVVRRIIELTGATSRSSSTSPTAPATTAATRWAARRSARWAGRRRCASPRAWSGPCAGTASNADWWEPIRSRRLPRVLRAPVRALAGLASGAQAAARRRQRQPGRPRWTSVSVRPSCGRRVSVVTAAVAVVPADRDRLDLQVGGVDVLQRRPSTTLRQSRRGLLGGRRGSRPAGRGRPRPGRPWDPAAGGPRPLGDVLLGALEVARVSPPARAAGCTRRRPARATARKTARGARGASDRSLVSRLPSAPDGRATTSPSPAAATRRRWRCASRPAPAPVRGRGRVVRPRATPRRAPRASAREAGMSKATFYEHFANKEECILALLDEGAASHGQLGAAADRGPFATTRSAMRRQRRAPSSRRWPRSRIAATLLVEVIGAGPARPPTARRDARRRFADFLVARTRTPATLGAPVRLPDDAFAIVGAIDRSCASRQLGHAASPEKMPRRSSRSSSALVAASSSRARRDDALADLEARVTRCRALPAPRRLARAGRAEARRLRRRGLLGPPGPGLRRPRRSRAAARPRARRPRRQPHRPRVHRRPLGRLPVRRAAPHRLRQPADLGARATTASAARRCGSRAAVRCAPPANKPRPPSATPACRGRVRSSTFLRDVAVVVCLGAFALGRGAAPARGSGARAAAAAALRPRRRGERRAAGRCSAASTRQPAEHVHRRADRPDARRRVAGRT